MVCAYIRAGLCVCVCVGGGGGARACVRACLLAFNSTVAKTRPLSDVQQ